MRFTVTGVETIQITDPQGLIDAQKPDPPDPLDALKAVLPGTRLRPLPTNPRPPELPAPPTPKPGPWTTPADPLSPRPYIGDPLVNPILLPGHTPAEAPRVPWAQWRHLTGGDDKWTLGLQAAHDLRVEGAGFGRKNATEQVW